MRNFIIQMLNALSIIIIVICTLVGGFIAIAATNLFIGALITLGIFIAVSVPMSMFLVLCSINDKLDSIEKEVSL